MLETHPFGSFVPTSGAKYLMLGSFTTKEANDSSFDYQWFYANKRNHFWPIMRDVYCLPLQTRDEMEALFTSLDMSLADIIYQCERVKNSNLDINLINIVYAIDDLTKIITTQPIQTIFFTSRFVETKFKRIFKVLLSQHPNILLVTLPSPSPRYAQMTRSQKVAKYRQLLPKLVQ